MAKIIKFPTKFPKKEEQEFDSENISDPIKSVEFIIFLKQNPIIAFVLANLHDFKYEYK